MKWITRSHVGVDRVACPWLIKRFVDSQAEFIFVARDLVMEIAEREHALPFDVEDVELGHHGADCSFVAIMNKYALGDPALAALADLVNAADTGKPETHPFGPALEALATGFSAIHPDDHDNISFQFSVYDAFYAYFKLQTAVRKKPAAPQAC
jgi:hypothetical protein